MHFVAEAERTVPQKPEACFARLADFSSWSRWMPASFQPASGPTRALAMGDVFRVRIRGVPGATRLEVVQFDAGRVLAWRGGVGLLLGAVHAFHFEPSGDGTRMRSIETWSGAFAWGPLAWAVKALAERAAAEELEALAGDLAARPG